MNMTYAKELLQQLKEAGKSIVDDATGRTVADAINNQLMVAKSLTPLPTRNNEPVIVLEALQVYNQVTVMGLSEEELNETLRYVAQYGVPKK